MAAIFISTYVIRCIALCLAGNYSKFTTPFGLYEFYIVSSAITEIPNLFQVYITHFKSFDKHLDQEETDRKT